MDAKALVSVLCLLGVTLGGCKRSWAEQVAETPKLTYEERVQAAAEQSGEVTPAPQPLPEPIQLEQITFEREAELARRSDKRDGRTGIAGLYRSKDHASRMTIRQVGDRWRIMVDGPAADHAGMCSYVVEGLRRKSFIRAQLVPYRGVDLDDGMSPEDVALYEGRTPASIQWDTGQLPVEYERSLTVLFASDGATVEERYSGLFCSRKGALISGRYVRVD